MYNVHNGRAYIYVDCININICVYTKLVDLKDDAVEFHLAQVNFDFVLVFFSNSFYIYIQIYK